MLYNLTETVASFAEFEMRQMPSVDKFVVKMHTVSSTTENTESHLLANLTAKD